jgi:hypothetical protein
LGMKWNVQTFRPQANAPQHNKRNGLNIGKENKSACFIASNDIFPELFQFWPFAI